MKTILKWIFVNIIFINPLVGQSSYNSLDSLVSSLHNKSFARETIELDGSFYKDNFGCYMHYLIGDQLFMINYEKKDHLITFEYNEKKIELFDNLIYHDEQSIINFLNLFRLYQINYGTLKDSIIVLDMPNFYATGKSTNNTSYLILPELKGNCLLIQSYKTTIQNFGDFNHDNKLDFLSFTELSLMDAYERFPNIREKEPLELSVISFVKNNDTLILNTSLGNLVGKIIIEEQMRKEWYYKTTYRILDLYKIEPSIPKDNLENEKY